MKIQYCAKASHAGRNSAAIGITQNLWQWSKIAATALMRPCTKYCLNREEVAVLSYHGQEFPAGI